MDPTGASTSNGADSVSAVKLESTISSEQNGTTLPDGPIAGPSRPSATTNSNSRLPLHKENRIAKNGLMVPGTGDGRACGDECWVWSDLPMNKGGYRYTPCAPHLDASPNPLYPFYRALPGPPPSPAVHLGWLDRSNLFKLSANAMTATSDRGFRSGRTNVSVRQGSWYYEVKVLRGNGPDGGGGTTGMTGVEMGNPHVRVGWGRREANLDAPVGMDGYSYAIRDVGGEKVHLSRPRPYGRSFKTGDVVGCLITLPLYKKDLDKIKRGRSIPLRYKGQLYFEMEEYAVQKEMEVLVDREGKAAAAAKAAAEAARDSVGKVSNGDTEEKVKVSKKGAITKNTKKGKKADQQETPTGPIARQLPILQGSRIEFFLNGESLGSAFEDLYDFRPLPPVQSASTPGKKGQSGAGSHAQDHVGKDGKDPTVWDDGTLGYYPMVSCFGKGKLQVNFGPEWWNTPQLADGDDVRPMCERWKEFEEEERILDERDEQILAERMKKEMAAEEERKRSLFERAAAAGVSVNGTNGTSSGVKKEREGGPAKKKRKGTDTPNSVSTPKRGGSLAGTPSGTPAREMESSVAPEEQAQAQTGNRDEADEKNARGTQGVSDQVEVKVEEQENVERPEVNPALDLFQGQSQAPPDEVRDEVKDVAMEGQEATPAQSVETPS